MHDAIADMTREQLVALLREVCSEVDNLTAGLEGMRKNRDHWADACAAAWARESGVRYALSTITDPVEMRRAAWRALGEQRPTAGDDG